MSKRRTYNRLAVVGMIGISVWGMSSILNNEVKASLKKNPINTMIDNQEDKQVQENEKVQENVQVQEDEQAQEYEQFQKDENIDSWSHIANQMNNYEEANEKRYKAYQQMYPEIEIEDIVWQVNVGLDKPYYEAAEEVDLSKGEPLVINKYNKLPDDYKPKELVALSSGPLVTSDTKEAYEKMIQDARNEGYTLRGVSGYRSIEYQKNLYNRYLKQDSQEEVDQYSARPGYSEHHTGRAIDLDNVSSSMSNFENTKEAGWVSQNAYRYGFILRYPKGSEKITGYMYEPWHITYVGVEIATEMKEQSIDTLEEYWDKHIKKKVSRVA